jgi:hypothetical protein
MFKYSEDELANLRFGMTEISEPGGAPGDYEEKLTQWFLERSFFRDCTYRNPRGKKKGQELADAVVLFEDVALLVQVKAQHGNHGAKAWATEAILKALKQVRSTHDDLKSGAMKKLKLEVGECVDVSVLGAVDAHIENPLAKLDAPVPGKPSQKPGYIRRD